MPSLAVTAPPCGPEVGKGAGELDGAAEAGEAPGAGMSGMVALAPSRISTWPAATPAPGAAVTPKYEAILAAPAEAPAPYSTSVVATGLLAFATCPAL